MMIIILIPLFSLLIEAQGSIMPELHMTKVIYYAIQLIYPLVFSLSLVLDNI